MNARLSASLLAAGCIAALFVTLHAAAAQSIRATAPSPSPAAAPTAYAEYRDDRWHFSIFVPSDTIYETTDARGGETIQFLGQDGRFLFQVSAWPYRDLVVHADGFDLQVPADFDDQSNELDTIHYVQDDLAEFLFHRNGVTYVVQSLPEDATSTLDILKSWQFI